VKVFIAGGSGALGKPLITQLRAAGHEVVTMTRSPGKTAALQGLGAEVAVADAFDRDAVRQAVGAADPEVLIHQLTSLAGATDFKHFDREFAVTNRLRTEGTDNLLAAAREAGVRRFIAQSFGGWNYERTGGMVKTEEAPLDPNPPAGQRQSLGAIRHLEAAVMGASELEGLVLRYGGFYGPGTSLSRDGEATELVRKRKFPIVGGGTGMWSFAHIEDAAAATAAAVDRGAPGIYNVADDEPVQASVWLPALAREIGAKPPMRIPAWLGRIVAGEVVVSMMTQIRGISNAKAKRELEWAPRYPSYREGFSSGLGNAHPERTAVGS
jgi:nucleoside-diphosphate-sugar epimerase